MTDDCVYVRAAVLGQLERDKRDLRRQLALARQQAETRAAAVSASEARAADLVAIIELNRSSADRALDQLRTTRETQRRGIVIFTLRTLDRRLKTAKLRRAVATWRRCLRTPTIAARALETPAFAFDVCFRLRFARRRQIRALAFVAWKALARQRCIRLTLGLRRRRTKQLANALVLWRYFLFQQQRSRSRLKRLFAMKRHRELLGAWAALRRACADANALTFADALDAARQAVDEEREQLLRDRHAVLSESHSLMVREEQRTRRFQELCSHRLAAIAQDEVRQRYFARWRLRVVQDVESRNAKLRVFRSAHWRQGTAFTEWKRRTRRERALRTGFDTFSRRTERARLRESFVALMNHAATSKRRRLTLTLLVRRMKFRPTLALGWRRWRLSVELTNQRLLLDLDVQQMIDRLEVRDVSLRHEMQRAHKLQKQAQLRCSLMLRDRRREMFLRSIFRSWAFVVRTRSQRIRKLYRTLVHQSIVAKRLAILRWRNQAQTKSRQLAGISSLQGRARRRQLQMRFLFWCGNARLSHQAQLRRELENQRLQLERIQQTTLKYRAVTLYHLFYRQWKSRIRRQALLLWRQIALERLADEQDAVKERRELYMNVWALWKRYHCNKLRCRLFQWQHIAEHLDRKVEAATKTRVVFSAWRLITISAVASRQRAVIQITAIRFAQTEVASAFKHWRNWQLSQIEHRTSMLESLCNHHYKRRLRRYWRRWERKASEVARSSTAKMEKNLGYQLVDQVLLSRQRRWSLRLVWEKWNAFMVSRRRARSQSSSLIKLITRKRELDLRSECFRRWKIDFVALQKRTRQRLAALLRRKFLVQIQQTVCLWQRHTHLREVYHLKEQYSSAEREARIRRTEVAEQRLVKLSALRVFSAWRTVVTRSRVRRQGSERLVQLLSIGNTRQAWWRWVRLTRISLILDRLHRRLERKILRMAWSQLVSAHFAYIKTRYQLRTLSVATRIWYQWQLRAHWQIWKTYIAHSRQLEAKHAHEFVLERQLTHWATQWYHRNDLRRKFVRWQQNTVRLRRIRMCLLELTKRRLGSAMRTWIKWAILSKRREQAVSKLLRRAETRNIRIAMVSWKHQNHLVQIWSSRKALLARLLEPPSASSIQSIVSRRPWLSAVFGAWKSFCIQRRRKLLVLSTRRNGRYLQFSFRMWRRRVWTSNRIAQLVMKRQERILQSILHQWHEEIQDHRQSIAVALESLVAIFQRAFWRMGWRALRDHHGRETIRRQSAIAFQSAQSIIEQHRRALAMRSAAWMFARRQRLGCSIFFQQWRNYVSIRKTNRDKITVTSIRLSKWRTRAKIRQWHDAAVHKGITRRNKTRFQTKQQANLLRRIWGDWKKHTNTVAKKKQSMTTVVRKLFERSVIHRLKSAWKTWLTFAIKLREQEQQKLVDTSHDRVLALISNRTQLIAQHQLEAKRQRLHYFAYVLVAVLSRSAYFNTQVVKCQAFDRWRTSDRIVWSRGIDILFSILGCTIQRSSLHRWWTIARAQQEAEQHEYQRQQTFKRAAALFASATNQSHKRSVMLQWKAFVATNRIKHRERKLRADTIKRRLAQATVRRCFSTWRRHIRFKLDLRARLHAWLRRSRQREARDTFVEWRQLAATRMKARVVLRRLVCIGWRIERESLVRGWQQWQVWKALDASDRSQANARVAKLSLHFYAWQRLVALKVEKHRLFDHRRRTRLLSVCFLTWKSKFRASSPSRTLMLFVLATNRCRARSDGSSCRPPLCSFHEFRRMREQRNRKRRKTWAAMNVLERNAYFIEAKRQFRPLAAAQLLRILHRQSRIALKLAFWTWIARIQTAAPSLWAVNLYPLTSRRLYLSSRNRWQVNAVNGPLRLGQSTGDVTSHIAALVLRDLRDAREQYRRKCWRQVAITAARYRHWWLRRGFERLRYVVSLVSRRSRVVPQPQYRQPTLIRKNEHRRLQAVAARVIVDRLASAKAGVSFRKWKAQYIAAALREAEVAHQALLDALRDSALSREILDPLRFTSETMHSFDQADDSMANWESRAPLPTSEQELGKWVRTPAN